MYYATETKISALTRIRRERVLPRQGEILVWPNDRVEATQVVARTDLPGDFRILRVARQLDISASKINEYLEVDLGDAVHQGTVIARRRGLLGRSVESPIDGVVTARGEGRILIEAQPTPFELHAYIPGIVLEVSDDRRVVIEVSGGLIQGTWGSGGETVGVLKIMTNRPHNPLRPGSVDPSCHGAILIGGVTADPDTLERAEDIEARGIVTGALAPELIPRVKELPFPVVVTEGIGDAPMAGPIFDLLRANEGEEASVSGNVQTRWRTRRPEVIIPKLDKTPSAGEETRDQSLMEGTRVRIIRAPHAGSVGKIVDLPRHACRIETGARVRCAEVDIGRDEPISVPLVNLDVLC
jgi:hypothetical protein